MNLKTPSLTLISSLAAGLLMAASVHAGEGHKGKKYGDGDRPTSISRDAFVEKSGARFDKVDADGDGVITEAEVDAAMGEIQALGPHGQALLQQDGRQRRGSGQP